MFITIYHSTQCNILEEVHLHQHCYENLHLTYAFIHSFIYYAYFWVYVTAVSMSEFRPMWHQMRSSRKITSSKPTGLLIEVITSHNAAVVTNSIEEGR